MTSPLNFDHLLGQILDYSHQLHTMAIAGEWEDMPAIERERADLIKLCFESGPAFEDADLAVKSIKEILDSDKAVLAMAAEAREHIGQGLDGLRKSRVATKAYQSHSR